MNNWFSTFCFPLSLQEKLSATHFYSDIYSKSLPRFLIRSQHKNTATAPQPAVTLPSSPQSPDLRRANDKAADRHTVRQSATALLAVCTTSLALSQTVCYSATPPSSSFASTICHDVFDSVSLPFCHVDTTINDLCPVATSSRRHSAATCFDTLRPTTSILSRRHVATVHVVTLSRRHVFSYILPSSVSSASSLSHCLLLRQHSATSLCHFLPSVRRRRPSSSSVVVVVVASSSLTSPNKLLAATLSACHIVHQHNNTTTQNRIYSPRSLVCRYTPQPINRQHFVSINSVMRYWPDGTYYRYRI